MEPTIQEQLEKRLAELPEDVRAAVTANDLGDRVRAIGAVHNLHIDKVGLLEDEVMLVMLGFSDINTFGENIAKQIDIPEEEGKKIAAEIGEKVFLPIRESLKGFLAAREQPAPKPTAPAAVSTPAPAAVPPRKELEDPLARPELHAAEKLLTQKTAVVPPQSTAPNTKPPAYKADPYREPVE